MAIVLPHVFQDNVSESASGVQVNENFNVLKAAIEALEALSPSLLHKPTGHVASEARAFSTLFKDAVSRDALVTATITSAGPFAVEILVNGARRSLIQTTVGGSQTVTFLVPAGQEWQAKLNTGSGMVLEVELDLL